VLASDVDIQLITIFNSPAETDAGIGANTSVTCSITGTSEDAGGTTFNEGAGANASTNSESTEAGGGAEPNSFMPSVSTESSEGSSPDSNGDAHS